MAGDHIAVCRGARPCVAWRISAVRFSGKSISAVHDFFPLRSAAEGLISFFLFFFFLSFDVVTPVVEELSPQWFLYMRLHHSKVKINAQMFKRR